MRTGAFQNVEEALIQALQSSPLAGNPASLFASVITLGEIRLGIEDLPPGKRRNDLEQWLDQGLPEWLENHLPPVTKAVVDRWGRLTIQAKRRGIVIAMADGLIAATALEYGLAIVTRNLKDFAETGVTLVIFTLTHTGRFNVRIRLSAPEPL